MKTEAGEEKMQLRTQIFILHRENKMSSNGLSQIIFQKSKIGRFCLGNHIDEIFSASF